MFNLQPSVLFMHMTKPSFNLLPIEQTELWWILSFTNFQGLNPFDTGNCPACCTFWFNVSAPFLMNEGKYPSSRSQDYTNLSLEVCTSLNQSQSEPGAQIYMSNSQRNTRRKINLICADPANRVSGSLCTHSAITSKAAANLSARSLYLALEYNKLISQIMQVQYLFFVQSHENKPIHC